MKYKQGDAVLKASGERGEVEGGAGDWAVVVRWSNGMETMEKEKNLYTEEEFTKIKKAEVMTSEKKAKKDD